MLLPYPRIEIRRHTEASPWHFKQLDQRQRVLAEGVRRGDPTTLLLSELHPVITYGRRTPDSDIHASHRVFGLNRTETFATDRGGYATYHGPGQWVLFPVSSLELLSGDSRGIQKFIQSLLEIALRVGLDYDSSAHIRSGCELGVWTDKGKFAAAGIHVERGVVLHGLSVNGFQTHESFQGLKPCGLDSPVDYLLKRQGFNQAQVELEFERLGKRILESTIQQFDLNCLRN